MNIDALAEKTHFNREELQRLLTRFIKLDKDSSGVIEKEEFLTIPAIAHNPLAARLMEVFDKDGDGKIDFEEFVSALSIFSSKGNKDEKLKFAFNVYDIDRDGKLSNGELFIVLKAMVGHNLEDHQLQQIVDKTIVEADRDGDGCLNFEEFKYVIEGSFLASSLTLDSF